MPAFRIRGSSWDALFSCEEASDAALASKMLVTADRDDTVASNTFDTFIETGAAELSNWRSIILFGRNVASYKFALAKSLIDLARGGKDSVTLEQLAMPYTRHLCEHLIHSPKQATSRSSKFLDTCKAFNEGSVSEDQLYSTTAQLGFNNVLDAFHVVNQNDVPMRFFEKDFSRGAKRVILTDNVFALATSGEVGNLLQEAESRWNLVETAWEMGINASLLSYDEESQHIVVDNGLRRKGITSVRGALNGYQKGNCFYCFTGITATAANGEERTLVLSDEPSCVDCAFISFDNDDDGVAAKDAVPEDEPNPNLCDVDHFFPHMLGRKVRDVNFDGVWNLVLACKDCNRGEGGKFARIPELRYLDRLYRRNEYLILSHHPLRESLIAQTGSSSHDRLSFLRRIDSIATELLPGPRWSIEQRAAATF